MKLARASSLLRRILFFCLRDTKTVGQAVLEFYSMVASKHLPIASENRPKLVTDLEADLFVLHALRSAMFRF